MDASAKATYVRVHIIRFSHNTTNHISGMSNKVFLGWQKCPGFYQTGTDLAKSKKKTECG